MRGPVPSRNGDDDDDDDVWGWCAATAFWLGQRGWEVIAWLPVKRLRVDSHECTETTALHIWAATPALRTDSTEIETFVGVHLPVLKRIF